MLEFGVFGCKGERYRAFGWPLLNMYRGRSVLTCVTDILSIDRTRAVTGFSVNFDAVGANWPREIGSVRSVRISNDRSFACPKIRSRECLPESAEAERNLATRVISR